MEIKCCVKLRTLLFKLAREHIRCRRSLYQNTELTIHFLYHTLLTRSILFHYFIRG